MVKGYGYFSWQKQLRFSGNKVVEVRLLRAQAHSVADRSLTKTICQHGRSTLVRKTNSVSGEVHGNFVASL